MGKVKQNAEPKKLDGLVKQKQSNKSKVIKSKKKAESLKNNVALKKGAKEHVKKARTSLQGKKKETSAQSKENKATPSEKIKGKNSAESRNEDSVIDAKTDLKSNAVSGKASPKQKKKKSFEKSTKETFKEASLSKKSDKKPSSKKRKAAADDDTSENDKKPKLEQLNKKERKTERKKQKTNFKLSLEVKKVWEAVRSEKCPEDKKKKLLNDLSDLISGKAKELIFAHDTVRVIECLISLGNEEQRTKLFEELKGEIILLMKCKYAKFFVLKFLKYGTKDQKNLILKAMGGNIVGLLKHTEAAAVVEYAYNEYAKASQRSSMVEEFYGPSFAVFKDDNAKTLKQVIEKEPSRKGVVLNHMKEVLLRLIEKSVVKHSIVHHALREFITTADEKSRNELIEASREIVVQVLHTKDGSRFAMNCLWHGTPKDRKFIIKSFKTHLSKICSEEEGHLVLLALFDCIDDTKIVEKIVLKEISQNINEISKNLNGRKVLFHLLSPRDGRFFHPDIVSLLAQGDGNKYSKKDVGIRRKELSDASSEMFIKLAEDRTEEMMRDTSLSLLLLSIFQYASGDLKTAFESIVRCLSEPYSSSTGETCHLIEDKGGHFLLNKLIQLDKDNVKADKKQLFLRVLVDRLPSNTLKKWIECNRGAFFILRMVESGIDFVMAYVKKELSAAKKMLNKKPFKGAKLLAAKL